MSEKWFYRMLGEEFGPVPREQILELIGDGTLGADDEVRSADVDDWVGVAAFQSALEAAGYAEAGELEEFSDLSELNLWSEDDAEDELSAAAEAEDDEDEVQCYCESMGQVLGPLSLFELIRLADSRTLGPSDRVRFGEDGDWVLPMEIPELAAAIFSTEFDTDSAEADEAESAVDETSEVDAVEAAATEQEVDSLVAEAEERPTKKKGQRRKKRAAVAGSGRRPVGRKRRKKKKRDELLEEIFSEVFTKDGKLKPLSERPDRSAAAAATGGLTGEPAGAGLAEAESAVASVAANDEPVPAGAGSQGQSFAGAQMPGVGAMPGSTSIPGAMSSGSMSTMAAGSGAGTVPKPQKPKRSSSLNFSMPEPRTLGIVGGVLAVSLLIAGVVTGMIPLPGFAPDPKSALTQFSEEYKQIAGSVDDEKWKAFSQNARPVIRQVIEGIAQLDSPTQQDKVYQSAAIEFVKLLNCKASDTERRQEIFEDFQKVFAGG